MIKNQLEITYLGGISEDKILAIVPLIYPNFSKGFDENYHDKVLGLTEITYNKAKSNFEKLSEKEGFNFQNSDNAISIYGKTILKMFTNIADKVANKFSDGELVSVHKLDQIIEYNSSDKYESKGYLPRMNQVLIGSFSNKNL